MTVAQIEELIRLREENRSALRRRMRSIRSHAGYQQAERELEKIDEELSELAEKRRDAIGRAFTSASK